MINKFLHRQLSIVDWDFIERDDGDLSAIHWYPGSFAPGLPGVLVDLLSGRGNVIFDPFCGVGSTAVAALLRGRNSISCDINPIGLIAGLSSTGLISLLLGKPSLFQEIFDDLQIIVDSVNRQGAFIPYEIKSSKEIDNHIRFYSGNSLDEISRIVSMKPSIEHLKIWYHPRTLADLLKIIDSIKGSSLSQFAKLVGFTMISAIARSTSSETRSWGHIADNVRPKEFFYKDAQQAASAWLRRTYKQLSGIRKSIRMQVQLPNFEFHYVDWLNNNIAFNYPDVSVLITSPPYGGAIDYSLAQRLSLYFMGFSDESLPSVVDIEIGARRKRFKPGHIDTWAKDLIIAVETQISTVNSDGYVVFVMPHKDHGRDIGENLLKETLLKRGWDLHFSCDRSVRQSRTRQSWTSIKKETIFIFGKGG